MTLCSDVMYVLVHMYILPTGDVRYVVKTYAPYWLLQLVFGFLMHMHKFICRHT